MGALTGKVAVVTGGGNGIGRQMALHFASEGAKVVVNDLGGTRDGSGESRVADEVVAEIKAAGGEAAANYDSVATMEGGLGIFQTAIDAFGAMDILVNNAGILRDKTIFKMTEQEWDLVIAVHLKGHFCVSQPFARYIRETNRPGCRIINFSSISGLMGNFGQTNYSSAKAGIAGFTRTLAIELKKYGTTVNAFSPVATTRMTADLVAAAEGGKEEEVDLDDPMTGGHTISPIVTWLASDKGAGITGQVIHGGRGTLGIMSQNQIFKLVETDHVWKLSELDKIIPGMYEAKQAHDAEVAKGAEPVKV
ncbi:MAG: SDR family NAD(P)-dependent oxidoreductase [Pseudomonadales bacterium]|nr:SDR family NAD(P)-dependent oxidoreductase [Pseudomonadales bacterium]